MMKKGFTLIEMMIAIALFSLIVLFLYKSYAVFSLQNQQFQHITQKMEKIQKIKRIFYLDFALMLDNNLTVSHQNTKADIVLLQTTHSLHNRINPYVTYLLKEDILYRIESFQKVDITALSNVVGDIDSFENVELFKLYKSSNKRTNRKKQELFLLHVKFTDDELLFKIKARNQY